MSAKENFLFFNIADGLVAGLGVLVIKVSRTVT